MNHLKKISDLHEALGIKPPEHPLFSAVYGDQNTCSSNIELEFSSEFYFFYFNRTFSFITNITLMFKLSSKIDVACVCVCVCV